MFRIKRNLILLLVVLFYSLALSLFYRHFCVTWFEEFDVKFSNVQRRLEFKLPRQDTYLVKIWGRRTPKKIYFNGNEVSFFKFRERMLLGEMYIKVDGVGADKGQNILDILGNENYSVKIRNFYGVTPSKSIYILFDSSSFLKLKEISFIGSVVLVFAALILGWVIFYLIIRLIFTNFDFPGFSIWLAKAGFILFLLVLITLIAVSFMHLRIMLSELAFLGSAAFLLLLTNSTLLFFYSLSHSQKLILTPLSIQALNRFLAVSSVLKSEAIFLSQYLPKLYLHFRTFRDQYLVSIFIFLMFICMVLLNFRLDTFANWISYLAYFCLTGGVFIKFLKLIKETSKK